MNKLFLILFCFQCTLVHAKPIEKNIADLFGQKQGCFLLKEIESGKILAQVNPETCRVRLYPCSSFKLALAVMGFDSGVLQDEYTTFQWDRTSQPIQTWEKDHNVRTWLKDSVVWYSQRITPKIGMSQIKKYLRDFKYGNQDFSGGITNAWLSSSLKISADEQVDFLIRLQKRELQVSLQAVEKTLSVLPLELDSTEIKISGKTGSGFSWLDPKMKNQDPFRVGWYIGYVSFSGKHYAFATVFKEQTKPQELLYAGPEAKKIAVSAVQLTLKNL